MLAVVVDPGRLAAGIVDQRGEVLVRDRIGTPTREVWRALEQLVLRVLAARPDDVAGAVAGRGRAVPGRSTSRPGQCRRRRCRPGRVSRCGSTSRNSPALPVVLDTLAGAAAEGELRLRRLRRRRRVSSRSCSTARSSRHASSTADGCAEPTATPGRSLMSRSTPAGRRVRLRGGRVVSLRSPRRSALEAEMNRPLRRATPSIIERTGIMVGRAIASAAAAFDVSTFLVSGTVVDTFGDPMLDAMRRELDAPIASAAPRRAFRSSNRPDSSSRSSAPRR